ncbi:hypothetical protein [Novipirellula galeiformis]|uniref:hypothetical protein n=1 Tax=Novipirellula galeiformis TaxID=2528004 RepID=UPI0011B792D0|nr:hypothetical protein [Novipirellula galeiformis]
MFDWQSVVALSVVCLAALWLLRGMVATIRKCLSDDPADAVGCGNCPKNPATKPENNLVQLSRPKRDHG